MRHTRSVIALLIILVFAAAPAAAEGNNDNTDSKDVGQWLSRAAKAVRTLSYHGVMVYQRRDHLDTLRVVHRFHDGIEQERLVAMTGRPREIIRRGNRVVSVLPESKVVLITHHRERRNLLSRVGQFSSDRMKAHYQLHLMGSQRLAGRSAQVISIQPRDQYRYGYRILIDKQTALPLKLNLLSDKHVLEQLMFTEIAYPEHISDKAFQPSYDVGSFRVIDRDTTRADLTAAVKTKWKLTREIPGFRLAESGVRGMPDGRVVRQMLFTDGVATVSAFIISANVSDALIGKTTMGAVHAYGRNEGDYHITVVGEVPAVTVRKIARHLVPRRDAGQITRDDSDAVTSD